MADIKICLFNPIKIISYPPLNLTYLSAYLKKYGEYTYDIKLIDVNCSANPLEEIISFNPDIIGFTTLSSHIVEIYNFSSELRKLNKNIVQICGGVHATINPSEVLEKACFDVAVIGEGEITFQKLIDTFIKKGKQLSGDFLSAIDGIAYKTNGTVKTTKPRDLISNLDIIPHPDRDLLDNDAYHNRYYVIRGMNTYGVYTITGSRGCPFSCIFCCVNFTVRNSIRHHSSAYIVDEIEELVSKYKAKWLFFTDDIFFIDKAKTVELCNLLIKRGLNRKIKWEVQIRSSLIKENDLPLLKLLKTAGCEQVDFGFESGNQRMLTLIKGKGITLADHQRAIDLTYEAGLNVMGTFILGTPSETYEEMLDTKSFIAKNYHKMHRFQVGCMIPYPGTKVYELAVEKGLLSCNYFEALKEEKETNVAHDKNIYCDTVPKEKILDLWRELDNLSIKKVSSRDKLKWLTFNFLNNPKVALGGMKWVVNRIGRNSQ